MALRLGFKIGCVFGQTHGPVGTGANYTGPSTRMQGKVRRPGKIISEAPERCHLQPHQTTPELILTTQAPWHSHHEDAAVSVIVEVAEAAGVDLVTEEAGVADEAVAVASVTVEVAAGEELPEAVGALLGVGVEELEVVRRVERKWH
jgi:hypothetical protein